MGNINEERRISNTQYLQQIQQVTNEQFNTLHCEEGALVKLGNEVYIGAGGEWHLWYPGFSLYNQLAWNDIRDTQYTSSAMYDFTANTPHVMPNDAGRYYYQGATLYKGSTQLYRTVYENSTWLITIMFKGHLNTSNGHMELYLENQFNGEIICEDVFNFPKGNGVEHIFSKTFHFKSDGHLINEGFMVKFKASATGSLYECKTFYENIQIHE